MDQTRLGLGTDQLAVPEDLTPQMPEMPLLPPHPRAELHPVEQTPSETVLAGLAPWAQQMQLPGVGD